MVRGVQTRSVDEVGGEDSYCKVVQVVKLAQLGCDEVVAAADSYSVRKLQGSIAIHSLLDVLVGGWLSIWVAAQVLRRPHARSDVAVGANFSYIDVDSQVVSSVQLRSFDNFQPDWYSVVALHTAQLLHTVSLSSEHENCSPSTW